MIARTAQLKFHSPDAEENTMAALAEVALPWVQDSPGFHGAYLLGPEAGEALLVTLWRTREEHDAALPAMTRAMAAIVEAGAEVTGEIRFYGSVFRADPRGLRGPELPI